MRLTLRTLLAYLDDVLQPAQAREIGDKINESPVATELVGKIREVMRRRRLTAPTLSGPGIGIDPNAVAEYIDGSLPPEGVADVEKICLESDVHLAEVASCHQILTLALGEPVEIPPNARERMYGLGPSAPRMSIAVATPRTEPTELDADSVDSVLRQAPRAPRPQPIGARPPAPAESFQETLPDYLKSRPGHGRVVGYVIAALVLLAWAALTFYNSPFKPRSTPVATARPGDAEAAADNDADSGRDVDDDEIGSEKEPEIAKAGSSDPESTTAQHQAPSVAGESTANESADDLTDDADLPAPPYRKTVRVEPPAAAPPEPPRTGAETESPVPTEDPSATAEAATKPVGKYVSAEGIALWFRDDGPGWYVMRSGANLFPGTECASPQPFEAAVELPNGLVTLLPGTAVGWLGESSQLPAGLALHRGEVLVRPVTAAGSKGDGPFVLTLLITGEIWRVELSSDAVFGAESVPPLPSKFEQRATPEGGLTAFHLASGRGKLMRTGRDEVAIELRGPASLSLPLPSRGTDQKWPQLETEYQSPVWMAPPRFTAASRTLATMFEKRFSTDEPVEITIPSVAADPNPRLAELATNCLALVGDAAALTGILQSTKHEESRQAAIVGLREWLLTAEEHRELLDHELARRYSEAERETVYRLLWGFDAEDAQSNDVSGQLVELMNHHEPSIRALAFHHVKKLTGRDYGYHPNGSDLQIGSALKQWRQHLARNENCLIKPKSKPKDR